MRRALCLFLFVLFLAPVALADDAFVRIKHGADDTDAALQTAFAVYTSPKTGVKVILFGCVHVADPAYYEKTQAYLDGYDVVLFEGVAPTEGMEPDESMKAIGELQLVMGDLLALQFQRDGIDYTRANLVHADMTQAQLLELVGGDFSRLFPMAGLLDNEQLKTILPMLQAGAGFVKGLLDANPAMRDRLKMGMASQLGSSMDMMGGDMQRILIEERNKVAMAVLERELAKRNDGTIAVFYGAAHMPDFEARLAELGFGLEQKYWLSAWTIGEGVVDELPEALTPAPAGGGRWF